MGKAKAWIVWLWRAWPAIVGLAALCLPLFSPCLRSEAAFRFASGAYQIAGVLLVSLGIGGKVKHFYRFGIGERVLRWLRESPAAPKTPITISGNTISGSASAFGVATVKHAIGHLPLDERIDKLHELLLAAEARSAGVEHALRQELERLKAEIAVARASVPSQISSYRTELGNVLAGGFKAEILGTGLLLIGVLFGSLPPELARMLN